MAAEALKVDSKRVVHETVDDETIIIDLESGSYFSLTGSGPEIWQLIVAGASLEQVAAELRSRYPDAPDGALSELVDNLVAEELVVIGADSGPVEIESRPPNGPFARPALRKFTDLQELLLIDPVHEIDETGWPHARQP